jgi:hypothetical protein
MSHPTYPRPAEPLVRQNPFRGQLYQPQPILTYAEAAPFLPIPELPEHDKWVEMYWRAWELAFARLRRPKANSGFVANFLDPTFNENTFMADTAYMSQFGLYGRRAFNFMGGLDNFYACQHDDGFICREINMETGADYFHPFDPNSTGPNILAWVEWRYFRMTGDDSRLAQVFYPLLAYHRWCHQNRTWPNGLYWATGLSSATDNSPRVPDGIYHHRHWTWVDANMQAAVSCLALGLIATYLNEPELAAEVSLERTHLLREINDCLWNTESSFYHDRSPAGQFSPAKSVTAYWALLDKDMVPKEQQEGFLRHLREATAFKRPHRVPSLSADSPGYEGESGNYWCGAVWSPTNFVVLKGLRLFSQDALAHEIASNHLEHVCQVFQRTDTFWENYSPETVGPGNPAKPDFVGWSGLSPIAILLEDVIGIKAEWPLRRLTWDRRLQTDAPYGVRNYPLGPDGLLTLLGDREKVTVTTTIPFTLLIQDEEGSQQTAVPAGTTELLIG